MCKKSILSTFFCSIILFTPSLSNIQVNTASLLVNSTIDAVDINPGDGVCETGTGNGICTLRAAIDESNALAGADTINIPAGTYTTTIPGNLENANQTGDFDISESISIIGAGSDQTIIDGGGLDRVFDFYDSTIATADQDLTMTGLTIQNGLVDANDHSPHGGAAIRKYDENSNSMRQTVFTDLIVQNNTITNSEGGAITFGTDSGSNSQLEVQNVQINDNTSTNIANAEYGAIFTAFTTEVNIDNLTIFDNNVTDGLLVSNSGALSLTNVYGNISNSTINDNNTGLGAGITIYKESEADLIIDNVNIHGNISTSFGGGVQYAGTGESSVYLNNSTIHNNQAVTLGGGIWHEERQYVAFSMYVNDSHIYNNSAQNGGGIATIGGHMQINKSLIENNIASIYGGGIYSRNNAINAGILEEYAAGEVQSIRTEILNTTIVGNESSRGSGVTFICGGSDETAVTAPACSDQGNGTIDINNTTIANNFSDDGSVYFFPGTGSLTFENNLVANNIGGDCVPFDPAIDAIISGSLNLSSDGTCNGFSLQNTNPIFGTFGTNSASNGLNTIALTENSPAVDAGDSSTCLVDDQRSVSRPQLNGCDLGAYEFITLTESPISSTIPGLVRTGGY